MMTRPCRRQVCQPIVYYYIVHLPTTAQHAFIFHPRMLICDRPQNKKT